MWRAPGKAVLGLLYLLVFGAVTWQIYRYWSHKAIAEAAGSKTFRMNCPGGSVLRCTFTEVPTRINQITEVIIPTVLCSFALLVASLTLLYVVRHPEVMATPEKKRPS